MQAVREAPCTYRCLGIPVPNVETHGCDEFIANRSLICMHSLAAAYYCNEAEGFIERVQQLLAGAGLDEEEGLEEEDEDGEMIDGLEPLVVASPPPLQAQVKKSTTAADHQHADELFEQEEGDDDEAEQPAGPPAKRTRRSTQNQVNEQPPALEPERTIRTPIAQRTAKAAPKAKETPVVAKEKSVEKATPPAEKSKKTQPPTPKSAGEDGGRKYALRKRTN